MQVWDDVERLVETPTELAEGPVWDVDRGVLWWVDLLRGHVHRYDPGSREDSFVELGEPVGSIGLRAGGGLIAACQSGMRFIDPTSGRWERFVDIEADDPTTRANDGKAGPDGCFWVGTMSMDDTPERGALYRVDPAGSHSKMLDRVSVSNGLDWIDEQHLYYIDSATQRIDMVELDPRSSDVIDRRTAITVPDQDGLPDGMALDAEGNIWVALFGGSTVLRYSPDGELLGRVPVPARLTTSCAFGGADLADLYITAASDGDGGGLYRCHVGVRGRAPFRFNG